MKPNKLLALFNLRPIEAELFSQLFANGLMSASKLAQKANISRTSVYDLLKRLIEVGLVAETLKGGIKVFVAVPPEKIQLLVEEKQKEILAVNEELESLKLDQQNQGKSLTPKLQLFSGQKELQQMMKDMLLYSDVTVYGYWPVKKIIELLGEEFYGDFQKKRSERNIRMMVIWPKNQIPSVKQFSFLKTTPEWQREVRVAPDNIDFSLGYSIYGNTVRFISSRQESFGFLVESSELAEMMKSQFEVIWKQAKPL